MDLKSVNITKTNAYTVAVNSEQKEKVKEEQKAAASSTKSADSLQLSEDAKKLASVYSRISEGFYDTDSVLLDTAKKLNKII